MKKLFESKMWHVLRTIAGIAVGVVTLWSGGITIADANAVQLYGIAAWTAANSWWLFPLSMFTFGLILGYALHKYYDANQGITAERMAELEAARDELAAKLAATEAGPSLEDRMGLVSGMALGVLWDIYLKGYAVLADECGIPNAEGYLISLEEAGLAVRAADGTRWLIKPDARKEIANRYDVQEELGEAYEKTLFVNDMESDFAHDAEIEAITEKLREQPYWQKVMLACLRDRGSIALLHDKVMNPDALDEFDRRCSAEMRRMISRASVGVSGTQITLSEDGERAVTVFGDFLKGADWHYFIAIDEEFADDDATSPFHVNCDGVTWLVNLNLERGTE